MKKNKKLLIISGIVIVVILAVVVAAVMMNNGHRVIKVESVEGEVELERDSSEKSIFEGMNLRSKDELTTGKDGLLGLLADEDKHIVAIENTCFEIVSEGNEKGGRLQIKLKYGTSLIEIENKLPEGATFEVETPNAICGIRGTTFEVTYIPETNTTILKVTEGVVEVRTDTETEMVPAGMTAVITDEHIVLTTMDFMMGDVPGINEGNGAFGEELNNSLTQKVYIQEDEWPDLLKGGVDKEQLEDLLAIVFICKNNGNEEYLRALLKQMCYSIGSAGIYQPEERPTDVMVNIYDIPTMNELFSFLTDEKIGEEYLYLDSYIEGDKVFCVYPDYLPLDENAFVTLGTAYYTESKEIIIEECIYNYIDMNTMESEIDKITVHLVPEDGKYIFGYIE